MNINPKNFILLLFLGCNDRPQSLDTILTSDCYWDILNVNSIHPINSCYYFNTSGDCTYNYYHFSNKKRTDSVFKIDDDDVVVPDKWKMVNDSIEIRSNKYFVIRYTADSVYLTANGIDTVILLKNCKTIGLK